MVGSVLSFGVSTASSDEGTTADTGCWDEYQTDGNSTANQPPTSQTWIQVVVPQGLNPKDCTPGAGCFFGSDGEQTDPTHLFVPHGLTPETACGFTTPGKLLREPSVQPLAPVSTRVLEVRADTVTTSKQAIASSETAESPTTAPPSSADATWQMVDGVTTYTPTTPLSPDHDSPGFVEDFDDNDVDERFRFGIYHRDSVLVAATAWEGDHDRNCGPPTTTRTIERINPTDSFYLCQGHLMTSVGDTSGYSAAFFSPNQTFRTEKTVSWSANITDLGRRQWWEVALLPLDSDDLVTVDWLSPSPSGLAQYPNDAVVVGIGPFAGDFRLTSGGSTVSPLGADVCTIDPEGCNSKTVRRTFTIINNDDGTITVEALGQTMTTSGSFPKGDFKVVFSDHNYTPNKDNNPVGYTWHWDDISIR